MPETNGPAATTLDRDPAEADDAGASAAVPLHARVHAILAEAIADGRIAPGTVLLEGPLAEIFGSSRGPVRQALARLGRERKVRRFEGRGHLVGDAAPARGAAVTAATLGLADAPERRVAAWEAIFTAVERAVIHRAAFGRFRVNELELARHFAVGRTVAHDVLTRLAALGMVDKDERRRWTVVPLDARRVEDLYEMRGHLEPPALLHAAPRLAAADVCRWRARAAGLAARYPAVVPGEMDRLEQDLHVDCLGYCGNRELVAALERTRSVLTLSKHVLGQALPLPEREPFVDEHIAVFDALAAGRAEAAADLLRGHLAISLPKVIERLARFRATYAPPEVPYIE